MEPDAGAVVPDDLPLDRIAQQVSAVVGEPTPAVRELVELHLGAIVAAVALDAPELIDDELRWQRTRLATLPEDLGAEQLDRAVRLVLREHLDPPAYAAAVGVLARATEIDGPVAPRVPPLSAAGRAYLDHALEGRREDALQVVRDQLAGGTSAAAVVLEVLQPAQVLVGHLWETGRVDVAQEHRVTATTQLCLSLLYPHLAPASTTEGTLVAAAVGSETHDLGVRMIADLMEAEGWSTAFLGANVPVGDLVLFLRHRRPDVLALSATMARHLPDLRDLVRAVRADPACARVRVLVGGRPFTRHPHLAALVGADATARSAQEALEVCRRWHAAG